MKINTNISSLMAQEANTHTNVRLSKSLEKLSSGLAINKASDDASGMAIADKLRTQAGSIKQSIANGNSGIALLQIADKAIAEQSNILNTVKVKLIQAKTATTSTDGREAIVNDINKLLEQLNNIAKQTNYNGVYLLQKSDSNTSAFPGLTFQMGENSTNTISISDSVQANTSGLALQTLTVAMSATTTFTPTNIATWMGNLDDAITKLNTYRSSFGAVQNQMEAAVRNMMTQHTNISAAESVIRDVDYAVESANFNKENIISQAGTFALSQAGQVQQNVLRLLQ
jgi:flagellin